MSSRGNNVWTWHTDLLPYSAKCAECGQPLRTHAGASVVRWRDGHLYAVGCLLDFLARQDGPRLMYPESRHTPGADAGNPWPWAAP